MGEVDRPNPDEILARLRREEAESARGSQYRTAEASFPGRTNAVDPISLARFVQSLQQRSQSRLKLLPITPTQILDGLPQMYG